MEAAVRYTGAMIFLTALAALTTAQSAAPASAPPKGWNEKEAFCIADGYSDDESMAAAELVTDGSSEALGKLGSLARDVRTKCATQWKWDERKSGIATLLSAAALATQLAEYDLSARYSRDKLEALFDKLPETDKFALTVNGYRELSLDQRKALDDRLDAYLVKEKVTGADVDRIFTYFVASARWIEAEMLWRHLLETEK